MPQMPTCPMIDSLVTSFRPLSRLSREGWRDLPLKRRSRIDSIVPRGELRGFRASGVRMITYSLSRILQTMFVLVAISFVAFLLVANLGDPLASLFSPDAAPADRAALIKALHLDDPLMTQFQISCWGFYRVILEFLTGPTNQSPN